MYDVLNVLLCLFVIALYYAQLYFTRPYHIIIVYYSVLYYTFMFATGAELLADARREEPAPRDANHVCIYIYIYRYM